MWARSWRPWAPIVVTALTCALAPLVCAQTYATPKAAAANPDFAIQGEYAGELGAKKFGAQVVALGDHKFNAVVYTGGLPGAGWQRGGQLTMLSGQSEDGAATFKEKDESIVIRDGIMTLAGQLSGQLKKVERKSPTLGAKPPAGAIVLFDGTGTDKLASGSMEDGLLKEGAATKARFADFTLHLEFRTPFMPAARGQGRGNSGIYIHNRYEVQVLDSFGLDGAFNECGALYRFRKPDVNMALPPLQWQTYDIQFTAARFDGAGKKVKDARVTVRHNGVVVQDDVALPKGTGAGGGRAEVPSEAIYLQNHGNPVRYRNIWIVPAK